MQIINDMQRKVQEFASENASTLLTAGGVVGVVGTAVLAGRAGYKYHELVDDAELERAMKMPEDERAELDPASLKLSKLEKLQVAGVHFVPPIITGGVTITAIIFANRMSAQKAAALAAAYGLVNNQFEEYKDKVAEKLTGPKQEAVNAELAQERANRTPGASQVVIIDNSGDVLCFDQTTGRYFKSSMEKINRAVNRTNEEVLGSEYAPLNFFYEELGLPPTSMGDEIGFYRGHLVVLDFDTILSPEDDSTPVLTINFKHMPTEHFIRKAHEY